MLLALLSLVLPLLMRLWLLLLYAHEEELAIYPSLKLPTRSSVMQAYHQSALRLLALQEEGRVKPHVKHS